MVTHASWTHPFVVNIPATVGGNTAYVGFPYRGHRRR